MIFDSNPFDLQRKIFSISYSLDVELENKEFQELEQELSAKITEELEKGTNTITFRSLDDIYDLFDLFHNQVSKKVKKLKDRQHLQFQRFLEEKTKQFREIYLQEVQYVEDIGKAMANLETHIPPDIFEALYLISAIHQQLKSLFAVIIDAWKKEQFVRKSEISKILDVFAGSYLLIFRLAEIEKLWSRLDEKDKQILKDLTYWDIDTVDNLTNSLTSKKAILEKQQQPDKQLLHAFWGIE